MTPITITGDTIIMIVLGILTFVGFAIAYMEYNGKEKLKQDYEAKLKEYKDIAEEDLTQSEELIKNKLKEIENVYKETIDDQNASLELYESYMLNFDAAITLMDKKLIDLDRKGTFSSDDEIGFFFRGVVDLQTILNKFKVEKEVLDNTEVTK